MNGNYLTELRRSNAAGIHDHRSPRSQQNRLAIMESEESMPNEDFDPVFDAEREPTPDELREISDDEDYDEYDDFDDEDYYDSDDYDDYDE